MPALFKKDKSRHEVFDRWYEEKNLQKMSGDNLTMVRLKEKYRSEIVPKLMQDFGYKNIHQVPALKKIVINMGVKEGVTDIKILDTDRNSSW